MDPGAVCNRSPDRTPPLPVEPPAKDEVPAGDEHFRALLAVSRDLKDFRETKGELKLAERRRLVEQAIVVLERHYVHLPFKIALHAVNPVRRLRRLKAGLRVQTNETMVREEVFHAELLEIFNSLHDLHTTYQLPRPYKGQIAYLPFLIEECWDDTTGSHFVVSYLVEGYQAQLDGRAPGFAVDAEVTHWNGIQIGRAVDLLAERGGGSNPAAQRSRAIEALTLRQLVTYLPPDEDWATITYRDHDGVCHELREPWRVVANYEAGAHAIDPLIGTEVLGLDVGTEALTRARRMLFAPESIAPERQIRARQAARADVLLVAAAGGNEPDALDGDDLPTDLEGVFRARLARTSSGTFGHLRIFTFSSGATETFISEFVRLVEALPQDGLIIDLRGNPGGSVVASESILQTLCPRQIEPEQFQFIITEGNLALCRKLLKVPLGLRTWIKSMELGLETGEEYSAAYPVTSKEAANAIGQKYYGPVVLITDARCYSAADIFAAGFQDHKIGDILGVDDNTGAGGAAVWGVGGIADWSLNYGVRLSEPYDKPPGDANFGFAIRRSLRVGPSAGMPLEDLGVIPDYVHRLTRNDLLKHNVDLLNRAGELLAKGRKRKLNATPTPAGDTLRIELDVEGVDRIDIYIDGRPRGSVDLTPGVGSVTVPGATGARHIRIEGFERIEESQDEKLVANRVLSLAGD